MFKTVLQTLRKHLMKTQKHVTVPMFMLTAEKKDNKVPV